MTTYSSEERQTIDRAWSAVFECDYAYGSGSQHTMPRLLSRERRGGRRPLATTDKAILCRTFWLASNGDLDLASTYCFSEPHQQVALLAAHLTSLWKRDNGSTYREVGRAALLCKDAMEAQAAYTERRFPPAVVEPRSRDCAEGCGGNAVPGSDLCAAHLQHHVNLGK